MRCPVFSRVGLQPLGSRLILLLAGLPSIGCGSTAPEPTDKAEALALLRTVLETWHKGEKPESLRLRQPPIWVSDPAWTQGARLVKFEIEAGHTQPAGYNLCCPVKLWLNDGKEKPRRVKFTIATAPALVVTRNFAE